MCIRDSFWTWLTIVSTRAFGTGLPLTTATFCASAANGAKPAAASARLAAMKLFFMVERAFPAQRCGLTKGWRPADARRPVVRSALRSAGVDREGVDAARHQ